MSVLENPPIGYRIESRVGCIDFKVFALVQRRDRTTPELRHDTQPHMKRIITLLAVASAFAFAACSHDEPAPSPGYQTTTTTTGYSK